MPITPILDRVLVVREAESTTTAGGIYIPITAQEKTNTGRVVAVGEGRANGVPYALKVKVDDVIIFAKHKGIDLKIGGTDYVLLSEAEIFCVVG